MTTSPRGLGVVSGSPEATPPTSRGGNALPATRQLHNRAKTLTEQYFARRHRDEYREIHAVIKGTHSHLSPGAIRSRTFTILRRRHRLEWARAWTKSLQIKQAEAGYVDGRVANGLAFRQRPEYAVPCPHCAASVDQPCRQAGGSNRTAWPPHKARFTAANQPYPARQH